MSFDLSKLKYNLFDGKSSIYDSSIDALYKNTYQTWHDTWTEEYRKMNITDNFTSDIFTKSDIICSLSYENKVIGVHLYSYYDLDQVAFLNHSFLVNNFNKDFLNLMKNKNGAIVMTMEQLTVIPEWRKTITNISLPIIIIALGLNVFQHTPCSSIIASTRNSKKINVIAEKLGFKKSVANHLVHSEESDLMYYNDTDRKPLSEVLVEKTIQYLWANRIDYTQITLQKRRFQKLSNAA